VSRFNLGVAEFHLDQLDEALRDMRAVPAIGPGVPHLHYQIGVVLAKRGDVQAARAEYLEALKLDPNLPEAQLNFGVILAEEGKLTEALPYLENAAKALPNEPQAQGDLAND